MNAYIYIEGGASGPHSKNLTIRCQQAFHRLLDRMGFKGRMPRLKACGGRNAVYEDFCRAHQGNAGYVAMWIDSEEPMADIEKAWKHLAEVTTVAAWKKPDGAADDQVLFMTTCMETWIVADRAALRAHYQQRLNENPLPHPNGLEARERHDVQDRLERATKDCQNAYAKGKRSFEILEKLDPTVLMQHLPSFGRVVRILKRKL
ncbi:MAG: DUF4276 family protein [Pirellulaceae bacterium]|nr:DUF4276 family protein [Pirellulaceae bacterium]